jgi:hypothetical protein
VGWHGKNANSRFGLQASRISFHTSGAWPSKAGALSPAPIAANDAPGNSGIENHNHSNQKFEFAF